MPTDGENRNDKFVWQPGDVEWVHLADGGALLDSEKECMPEAEGLEEDCPVLPQANEAHFYHSTLRERIVEHVFIGDALRRLWQLGVTDVEVLRSEFDAGGYDLVMSRGKFIRHIQFKSVMTDGKATHTSISLKLLEKPSGCVIWIVVTPQLDTQSYLWFGGKAGDPLPNISDFPMAKHTKGNAKGTKTEKPNHRIVRRSQFKQLDGIDAVLQQLFGDDLAGGSNLTDRGVVTKS